MFKASYDNLVKVISFGVFLLLFAIAFRCYGFFFDPIIPFENKLAAFIPLITVVLAIVISFAYSVSNYQLDKNALIIQLQLKQVLLPFDQIQTVSILSDDAFSGAVRTFGSGGLFGYFGKYRFTKFGIVTVYATQRKNRVLIEMKNNKKYLITPDDTHFVGILKEKLMASQFS